MRGCGRRPSRSGKKHLVISHGKHKQRMPRVHDIIVHNTGGRDCVCWCECGRNQRAATVGSAATVACKGTLPNGQFRRDFSAIRTYGHAALRSANGRPSRRAIISVLAVRDSERRGRLGEAPSTRGEIPICRVNAAHLTAPQTAFCCPLEAVLTSVNNGERRLESNKTAPTVAKCRLARCRGFQTCNV
jgi:hypothetical protein